MAVRTIVIVGVIVSLAFLVLAILPYVTLFGFSLSDQHERWAEFGNYFGGILAPVFAMFAFWAVFYAAHVQGKHLSRGSRKADLTRVINTMSRRSNDC